MFLNKISIHMNESHQPVLKDIEDLIDIFNISLLSRVEQSWNDTKISLGV